MISCLRFVWGGGFLHCRCALFLLFLSLLLLLYWMMISFSFYKGEMMFVGWAWRRRCQFYYPPVPMFSIVWCLLWMDRWWQAKVVLLLSFDGTRFTPIQNNQQVDWNLLPSLRFLWTISELVKNIHLKDYRNAKLSADMSADNLVAGWGQFLVYRDKLLVTGQQRCFSGYVTGYVTFSISKML